MIEHHLAVVAPVGRIIDGGRIVVADTRAESVSARATLTSEDLAAYVGD
jgi:hypothetical protein